MFRRNGLVTALAFCICLSSVEVLCLATLVQDREAIETCSIFEVSVANLRAIESADVLVRIRESADTFEDNPREKDGLTLNTECFRRVAFDLNQKNFVQLQRKNIRILNFETEVARETIADEFGGFCLDFSQGILFSNDHKKGYQEKRKFPDQVEELAKSLGQFDVRGFWMYPLNFEEPDAFMRGQKQWDGYQSARLYDSSRALDNGNMEINFKIHGPVGGPTEMQWHFAFDDNRLPISMSETCLYRGTQLKGPWMKLKWMQIGDYFVPQSYEMRTVANMQVGTNPSKAIFLYTTVDLDWLTINQPIGENLLNAKSVSGSESIIKLTSPELVGADSLKPPSTDKKLPIPNDTTVK